MKLNIAPLVFLIFILFAGVHAQDKSPSTKIKLVIKELKMLKSTGILLSEAEMTRIVFEELEKLSDFDVKYVLRNAVNEEESEADLIIEGEYELEENLITLNYQIKSEKTRMRVKQKASQIELDAVKNEILTNISELFSQVTFISNPPNADIEIDGVNIGTTPITLNHLLNGYHLLHLKNEGYFGIYRDFDISKSDTIVIELFKKITANEATPPTPKGGIAAITRNVKYPESLKRQKIEGEVVVLVLVDKNGKIRRTEIIKSIGKKEFDKAAVAAIKSVKWKASMLNNEPTEGSTQVKIKFKSSR